MYDRKRIRRIAILLCLALLAGICVPGLGGSVKASAAKQVKIPAKINATNVNIRKKAGTGAAQLTLKKNKVVLQRNKAVTILSQTVKDGDLWYRISFQKEGASLKGYVHSDFVTLKLNKTVSAVIKSTKAVTVKKEAGGASLKAGGKAVSLKSGKVCTILEEKPAYGEKWFLIAFDLNGAKKKGYVPAEKVRFTADGAKKDVMTGTVKATSLNVRAGAGIDKRVLEYNGAAVRLTQGQTVTITNQKKVENVTWYQVTFTYDKVKMTGYVSGDFVELTDSKDPEPTKEPEPTRKPAPTPEPTRKPEPTKEPEPTEKPSPTPKPTQKPEVPVSDAEFEQLLDREGFPEDYKDSLRLLHAQYPLWQFRAYQTGIDWNLALDKESRVGTNLIPNSRNISWKSFEKGAYDWATDRFIPFDGSSWVTASREGTAYYMDPRNFLTPEGIFQFELLSFDAENQNAGGVESILKGTPLADTLYTWTGSDGQENSSSYAEIFMQAAQYSGVNPYHLASRVKQEVITGTGLSSSVSGTVAGYEGLYNFYNIGASNSTAAGGSVANGLKFARDGKGLNAASQETFLLPWDNHYNAIVGGAKYIGTNYINRGQNTIYLQKFNMTPTSQFAHQYMANVEAAKAEAQKVYGVYKNITDAPLVFSIPVYENMPEGPCPEPFGVQNPNNWLASLSVDGAVLTPTFRVGGAEDTVYTALADSTADVVTVNAKPVSAWASVSGTGPVLLAQGGNTVTVTVTAQNGSQRTYTIYIMKAG